MPGPNYYAYYGYSEPEPKKEDDKTWAILTQYDIAHRRAHIELEGRKTGRMKDIDNYIAYINNEMPATHKIFTVLHPAPYNVTYDEYEQAMLYSLDESDNYVPSQPVRAMKEFMGDKVVLQRDQAFVVNTEIGYAVPAGEYVRMVDIETQDGYQKGYAKHQNFRHLIHAALGLMANEVIGEDTESGEDDNDEFDV